MPIGGVLGLPFHGQSIDNGCGPACCAMIFDGTGKLPVGSSLSEESLLECLSGDAAGVKFWSLPERLEAYFGIVFQASTPSYSVVRSNSQERLTHQIIWGLRSGKGPALVLTESNDHWVVVIGYCISREPVSIDDSKYDVFGLFVWNPADYPVKKAKTHEHGDSCKAVAVREGWVSAEAWRKRIPSGGMEIIAILDRPDPITSTLNQTTLAINSGFHAQNCRDATNVLAVLDGSSEGKSFKVTGFRRSDPSYTLQERWRMGRCVALVEVGDRGEIQAVAAVPAGHPWEYGIKLPDKDDLAKQLKDLKRAWQIDWDRSSITSRLVRPLDGPARSRFAPQLAVEIQLKGQTWPIDRHISLLLDGANFERIRAFY